jgi:hypothetical protein
MCYVFFSTPRVEKGLQQGALRVGEPWVGGGALPLLLAMPQPLDDALDMDPVSAQRAWHHAHLLARRRDQGITLTSSLSSKSSKQIAHSVPPVHTLPSSYRQQCETISSPV